MTRHVLSMTDLSPEEVRSVLDLSTRGDLQPYLSGQGVALYFEHPSARTRNAAEMAVVQLGGHPVVIRGEDVGIGVREPARDVARVFGGFFSMIGARVARHSTLEEMRDALDDAGYDVPIVNLLSDREHPSQALADLLTIEECFATLEGIEIAYIGDANNVCRSLAEALIETGASLRIASPPGFRFADEEVASINAAGSAVRLVESPKDAATGAHVLYTDVWVSMGDEAGAAKKAAFSSYTIDDELVALARPDAVVLHCLPAHRGEEITDSVIEGRQSRVFQQATNRMHTLRGLFYFLMGTVES